MKNILAAFILLLSLPAISFCMNNDGNSIEEEVNRIAEKIGITTVKKTRTSTVAKLPDQQFNLGPIWASTAVEPTISLCTWKYAPSEKDSVIAAINEKNLPKVKRLLLAGANPNEYVTEKISFGHHIVCNTALWHLIESSKEFEEKDVIDIIDVFIAQGANVRIVVGKNNATLLHSIVFDCRVFAIDSILAAHPDVNAKTTTEYTPLHYAVWRGKKNAPVMAEKLLNAGADVNAQNNDGETPLHLATRYAKKHIKMDIITLLLKYDADNTIKDMYKKTPYDYAQTPEIQQLLTNIQGLPQ